MRHTLLLIAILIGSQAWAQQWCQNLFQPTNNQPFIQVKAKATPLVYSRELHQKTYMILKTTLDSDMLRSDVKRFYARLLKIDPTQLSSDKVLRWFERTLNLDYVDHAVLKDQFDRLPERPIEYTDMDTSWGYRLISEADPIFHDLDYRQKLVEVVTNLQGVGLTGRAGDRLKSLLFNQYDIEINKALDFDQQRKNLEKFNVNAVAFFETGSDANSALSTIAQAVWDRRISNFKKLGHAVQSSEPGRILPFMEIYGGVRGELARSSFYVGDHEYRRENSIPSPVVESLTGPHQNLPDLVEKENQALRFLENKLQDPQQRVGGVFIEPIVGSFSNPVRFYRAEFLLKVQELCRQYEVPVMADEILTGGGRTGRLFGFMHYQGFVPDYITVGKGLQVAAILQVNSESRPAQFHWTKLDDTTVKGSAEHILKSIQVLKAINQGRLTERAEAIGEYFVSRIKATTPIQGDIRAVGLFIAAPTRLLPYLTITKEEVDLIIERRSR